MIAGGWILSCRCQRAAFRGFRALPLCRAVRAPSWPCSHELIRLWSTGSGVRLQVDVDAHAGEQRRLADEINHDLKRVDVGGLARPALADAAWPQRLPERGDLAIEILAREGVGANDRRLADPQLADVALFDLRPDPQRGEVAEHDQNVFWRGRHDLAWLGRDLQCRAGGGCPDARAFEGCFGSGKLGAGGGERHL